MNGEKQIKLVALGSYTQKQADTLRAELEKNGIPAQSFYPQISEGRGEWLAEMLMIEERKVGAAIKICKKLDLPFDAKAPQSRADKIFNWIFFLLILGAIFAIGYFLYSLKR
ncbi:MAG: hypothetical protein AUJ32_01830 [Parcubacteria group bacterium CG1_02_40_82]|uniref:DUF2007 domain-containing protein n=3 Tax=Candidatus Portnoyibacteriota TaxID=1817913 RepID=A0A2M7YP71_9BACT|nr:MAG: hypothetical protein AUJ32_01830 [Parcubacteria group bacterium CG1_02_40_82]PIQ74976.1 MAG: hypothetical protein COV84_03645 [Candidatus Portnoybacteria bacterium CG11_big_fil_rev_8_21_14_0_20_40_15]PIS31456.1 MAG: hypothetical protein COT41_01840 [Candidatus Portnoybacteria bacterium CG08_land_8_20_14_0_20_40_83]PIY75192.1 MAG: hypothetical protein COY85_00955 [Candidatus Portnoybacteria bacterium CG_4_10_14_0_8_um_filter_40_50]PJA64769.1 MAG: hypothetical protein CO159_01255 [Candida